MILTVYNNGQTRQYVPRDQFGENMDIANVNSEISQVLKGNSGGFGFYDGRKFIILGHHYLSHSKITIEEEDE